MRTAKIRLLFTAMIAVVCLIPILALGENGAFYSASQAPCGDCHLCPQPTKESPCLQICPQSANAQTASHKIDEGPRLIVLGQPGNLYEPVMFDHRSHAGMGSMGDGCVSCHHYTPDGHVPPCSECHLKPAILGQPGLKGAYHRQCLGCHKKWSGSNECTNCHALSEATSTTSGIGLFEQVIQTSVSAFKPDKKVYDLSDQNGEKVTFYHNDHVEKFGVECATCHQRESCGYCHDPNGSSVPMKSAEEIHAICNDCHDGDNCQLCHGKKEKSPFTHDASHWRLGEYHRHLPCQACHEVGRRIKSLKADCTECHDNWGRENFDHQLTGLKLDETHRELDCTDCHSNKKYHQPPTCIDCHDEDRTPRATPPGTIIGGIFGNDTNSKEIN